MMATEERTKQQEQGNRATTILDQLGGNRMAVMTGAKAFVATERGLRFKLPNNLAKNGINMVEVDVNDLDLYDIRFIKLRLKGLALTSTNVAIFENVGAEQLRSTFTEATGLNVSL